MGEQVKIELKDVLDNLDSWIEQTTSLDHIKFSYRSESGHLVTIEATKRTADKSSEVKP